MNLGRGSERLKRGMVAMAPESRTAATITKVRRFFRYVESFRHGGGAGWQATLSLSKVIELVRGRNQVIKSRRLIQD